MELLLLITFALSVEGDFDYASDCNGNIEANNQYFTIRNGDFTNDTSIVLAGDFGVSADDFINTNGDITVDNLLFLWKEILIMLLTF